MLGGRGLKTKDGLIGVPLQTMVASMLVAVANAAFVLISAPVTATPSFQIPIGTGTASGVHTARGYWYFWLTKPWGDEASHYLTL